MNDDIEKLRQFAQKIMEVWPEGDDVDFGSVQDWAIEFGLLEPCEAMEPCGENCFCEEYYGSENFPLTCYRKTKLLMGK